MNKHIENKTERYSIDKANEDIFFDIRLFYYGKPLDRAIEVLDRFLVDKNIKDPNEIMELWNISQLFNDKYKEIFNNDIKLNKYSGLEKEIIDLIKQYFIKYDINNLVTDFHKLFLKYKLDFWDLFIKYEVYKKIPKNNIIDVLYNMNISPNNYLKYKSFVKCFDKEIGIKFNNSRILSEIFIEYCADTHDSKYEIYIPEYVIKNEEYKIKIIKNYINQEHTNNNYLNILLYSADRSKIKIDDKLRYEIKQKIDSNLKELFKYNQGLRSSIELRSEPGCKDTFKFDGMNLHISYDANELEAFLDYPDILNNFIYKFDFVNCNTLQTTFYNRLSQDGTLEKFFILKGEHVYRINHAFKMLEMLSLAQMDFYYSFLKKKGIYFENVIKWFFITYLKDEFGIDGFIVDVPNVDASYGNKCYEMGRLFDQINKGFSCYCDRGCIDRDYIEFSSSVNKYDQLPSLIENKYLYFASNEIQREMFCLFSDQSMLFYIDKYKSKYDRLDKLLLYEKVTIEDFYDYQKSEIIWLIERNVIINSNNFLKLNDKKYISLLQYYCDEVINTNYVVGKQLGDFNENEIKYESTLLSKPESDYFEYYLSKEFTNGPQLRNKYIHGSNTYDNEQNRQDYMTMLKLIVILIIKINDELCIVGNKNKTKK